MPPCYCVFIVKYDFCVGEVLITRYTWRGKLKEKNYIYWYKTWSSSIWFSLNFIFQRLGLWGRLLLLLGLFVAEDYAYIITRSTCRIWVPVDIPAAFWICNVVQALFPKQKTTFKIWYLETFKMILLRVTQKLQENTNCDGRGVLFNC